MNDTERAVLRAAAKYTKEHRQGGNQNALVSCEARHLFSDAHPDGLSLQEVSVALLLLRDQGYVVTEEPTVGDPRDGEFAFHVTPEGMQAADV